MNIVKYNGKVVKHGSKWVEYAALPALGWRTIRVRTLNGEYPRASSISTNKWDTVTKLPNFQDIYDIHYIIGDDMANCLKMSDNIVEVLGINLDDPNGTPYSGRFSQAFYGDTVLERVCAIDTSRFTRMTGVFEDCYKLVYTYPMDLRNCTDISSMFNGNTEMEESPIFTNTSLVTNTAGLFAGCSKLTTVHPFDTSSVTYAASMFLHTTSLRSIPAFSFDSLTGADSMFSYSGIDTFPTLYNTTLLEDMSYMFSRCSNLHSIGHLSTNSVTNVREAFRGIPYAETGILEMYQQLSGQTNPPTTYAGCFYQCGSQTVSGQAALAQIPSSWGGTGT